MKKLLCALLAATLVAGAFAGCGDATGTPVSSAGSAASTDAASSSASSEAQGEQTAAPGAKTLIWNNGAEPTTIDPGVNGGTDAAGIILHMYEGLLKEKDNEMIPAIAETYDVSDDLLTYTFHLRDAKWSDGEPVKAKDFAFAWNRVKDPVVAAPFSWIYDAACIESFQAVDDKTFEVKLSSPAPYFLSLLDNTAFMPLREDKINYAESDWARDPARNIGNGAFQLEKYTTGDRIILTKNPNYYDAANVKIERMEVLMIVDTATALTGYESGQIDVLKEVPTAEVPRLLNEDQNFSVSPTNGSYFYCFNVTRKPFDDIRVRQALSYAIDRSAIVNDVTKGGEEPAHSLIPSVIFDSEGNQFNVKSGDYGIPADLSKLEQAKTLLSEAGYPDGAGLPEITILYDTNDTHKIIAETIQQMWKANLNINVKLLNMESQVFHTTRVAHDFDACRGGWFGDYNDPLTYLDMYVPGTIYNYAGWSSDDYNTLVVEGKTKQGTERFEKFYAADKLLSESFAYMPIYYYTTPTLVNGQKVTNWFMNSKSAYNFVNADIAS